MKATLRICVCSPVLAFSTLIPFSLRTWDWQLGSYIKVTMIGLRLETSNGLKTGFKSTEQNKMKQPIEICEASNIFISSQKKPVSRLLQYVLFYTLLFFIPRFAQAVVESHRKTI